MNDQLAIARLGQVDAGQCADQPFADRAVGIVIEGVHILRPEAAVGLHAVPVLPHGGRAAGDRVQPGGIVALEQQPSRRLMRAALGERQAQIGRADEAGGQMAAVLLNQLDQLAHHARPVLLFSQIEMQSERIGSLRAHSQSAARRDELAPIGLDDAPLERAQLDRVLLIAQHLRRALRQIRRVRIKRRGDERLVGRAGIAALVRIQSQPVAELRAVRPQVVLALRFDVFEPAPHGGIGVFQHALVVIALIERPGHDGGRVAPGRAAVAAVLEHLRHDERHSAVLALIEGKILQPFGQHERAVHVDARRAAEGLAVARPAQPLVALRAVGGHVHKVAPLPPLYVVEELIDALVRAAKARCHCDVRADDHAREIAHIDLARPVFQTHIAEAEERELRLEGLPAAARERIADLRLGDAVVFIIEVAVLVQHLAVTDDDTRARRPLHAEAQPADHVLPQIEHLLAARRGDERNRRDDRLPPHGVIQLRGQLIVQPAQHSRVLPGGIIEVHVVPAGHFHACVVFDAHVVIDVPDRRFGERLPLPVGDDRLLAAVLKAYPQLGQQRQLFAKDVAVILIGQIAAIPAIAQRGGERVSARFKQRGHIPGLILHAAVIVRPAGAEQIAAHVFAVQAHGIDAQRRGVQARALYLAAAQIELAAEARRALHFRNVALIGDADPLRGEGTVHHAGFKGSRLAELTVAAPLVPDAHAPAVAGARLERRPIVGHEQTVSPVHAAGIPQGRSLARPEHLQLIAALNHLFLRHALPAEARPFQIQSNGVDLVFTRQIDRLRHSTRLR